MREDKKINLDELLSMLQERMQYKDENSKCRALYGAWLNARKLPKLCKRLGYKPPSRQTIKFRIRRDGFAWLKIEEVRSFERYAGYPICKNE